VHIIVAAPWTPSLFYSIDNVNLTLTEVFDPKLKIIITKLRSDRAECIPKDKLEQFYKEGGNIKVDKNDIIKAERSVGDEIEEFYEEMKFGILFKLTKIKNELNYNFITFHLSLLSGEEEQKMDPIEPSVGTAEDLRIGSDGLRNIPPPIIWKFQNFKSKTRLSKNENNYALSVCHRKTFFRVKKNKITKEFLQSYTSQPNFRVPDRPIARPRPMTSGTRNKWGPGSNKSSSNIESLFVNLT